MALCDTELIRYQHSDLIFRPFSSTLWPEGAPRLLLTQAIFSLREFSSPCPSRVCKALVEDSPSSSLLHGLSCWFPHLPELTLSPSQSSPPPPPCRDFNEVQQSEVLYALFVCFLPFTVVFVSLISLLR